MNRKKYSLLAALSVTILLFITTAVGSMVSDWLSSTQETESILGTTNQQGFEQAVVSRVIDGDTIELSDGRKVRYIGIDTPETKHPQKRQECFGQEATQENERLVLDKTVYLEKDVSETDRYGRLLRYVWLEDQLVNKTLVEAGHAYASSYPPDIARQEELVDAQVTAQSQNVGLWANCELVHQDILGSSDVQNQAENLENAESDCEIKGNISSNGKLYHLPSCSSYAQTKISEDQGERWFCTEQEAVAAGWEKAASCL